MAVTTNLDLMHGGPTAFIDVEGEIDFWRRAYRDHPAFSLRRNFTDYEPALRIGIEAFIQDPARTFEECRDSLEHAYEARAGVHRIHWDEAGSAAAAAWHRLVRRHRTSATPAVHARPGTPVETAIAS